VTKTFIVHQHIGLKVDAEFADTLAVWP